VEPVVAVFLLLNPQTGNIESLRSDVEPYEQCLERTATFLADAAVYAPEEVVVGAACVPMVSVEELREGE